MHAYAFPGPQNEQQVAIVEAFKHAWKAYKKYAWGHDELLPITKTYNEWFGIGLTIIDGLDTMYIMGLKDGRYYNDEASSRFWNQISILVYNTLM